MPGSEEARRALEDHRAKVSRELDPRESGGGEGVPAGEPGTGVLVVLEPPEIPAVLDALHRSLESVGHSRARVVPADERLGEEILSGGPSVIAAIGPRAARALDDLEYPLAHARFSEQREGEWFVWSKGVRGLSLPALAPALEDEEAKRGFWRAFLTLRALEPGG
ncbi:uracil-DNA glycosylase family protein [Rubrobacter aplysinae]|uniref:hypothetical protein n=1 Tax=Rubrobacter aplysinae TaxID=909625 RepID=UPI00064BC25C|nr:hypothetical protein [Rubrobacter aplysinae]